MSKTLATTFLVIALAAAVAAADPKELVAAREQFQKQTNAGEVERQRYLLELAALRSTFADARRTADWQAVDAEMRQHPVPKDADSSAYAKTLAGEWASPRHNYLFRPDGTWSMLPVEPDITHGRWRIEGNQYFDTVETTPPQTRQYTILLLTARDFIFTDGKNVFFETRLKK